VFDTNTDPSKLITFRVAVKSDPVPVAITGVEYLNRPTSFHVLFSFTLPFPDPWLLPFKVKRKIRALFAGVSPAYASQLNAESDRAGERVDP
jgi:hypothetical protein